MKRTLTWDSIVWDVKETESADSVEITIEGRLDGLDDDVRDEILQGSIEPKSIDFDVDADADADERLASVEDGSATEST